LYWITIGKELEPNGDEKKVKWENKNEEACGMIKISVSLDLRFHLQGINDVDDAWAKLEIVFGKHNNIRAH
jgi:hypothetical protein